MKQVFQNLRTGETMVGEVPIPSPQPGKALIRTAASLVSAGTERMLVEFAGKSLAGKARSRPDLVRQTLDKARREGLLTTLEAVANRLDQPLPLGYSSAGTIVSLPADVQGFHVGQRVACAGGGYAVHAEYALVPRNLLAALPENVDFEAGAFATLGAIALHGFRLAEVQLGERVAVIGLGLLGLLAAGVAHAAGCHVLGIDLDAQRVSLAKWMGAEGILRAEAEEAALSFSQGHGCDAVIICADTPTADPVELAGQIARDRARVIAVGAVGLNLPRKIYYEKELTFINSRSYGPGRYDPAYEESGQDYPIGYVRWSEGRNLQAFIELLAEGRLDVHPLITHRFPIERAAEAYALISGKRREPYLGVLLTYSEEKPAEPGSCSTPEQPRAEINEATRSAQTGTRRVSLGVLGAGNFARAVMLPALKDLANLERVGIASASGLSAKYAVQKYGFRYASADEMEIIQDGEINTIAILTRHHLHARQTLAALRAGKNVYCEKPLAINAMELDEIQTLLEDPACPMLMVGFNRRFAPLTKALQAFLRGRREPMVAHYRVNAGYLPLEHWLHDPDQGGGRIIGEACHFIDFLSFLAGAPPIQVSAQALPDDARYREDNVLACYVFPDGSLGTLSYLANGDRSFSKERVEIFSGGRVAVLDDFRRLEMVQGGRRTIIRSWLRQDKGHRGAWKAFCEAIVGEGAPPIPYSHLLGVSRAAFATVEAIRQGKKIAIPPV